jgi:UDP-N-acetylenolpyruvoylglucosamine reductase
MSCTTPIETPAVSELVKRLSPAALVRPSEPLAKRTTLRVGGAADFYVEPASEQDLAAVLSFCGDHRLAFFVLGRGSNLLVRDGGYRGVVICLAQAHFTRIELAGERLRSGAGAKLRAVSMAARQHQLSGLEFLEGIPGSVGGGLRMNAGAMGSEVFQVLESVRCMDFDGGVQERQASGLGAVYRSCASLRTTIVLEALFRGVPGSRDAIEGKMAQYSQRRWGAQPAAASAGCAFKNPVEIPAGKLVDELGLKGVRIGGAAVSLEHGNFIVNEGSATARDVLALIDLIKQRAQRERGIKLETEIELVGEE